MDRSLYVLAYRSDRERAHRAIDAAEVNSRVEIKGPARSLKQNRNFWGAFTDIAEQLSWHGMQLSPAQWRLLLIDGFKGEMSLVPNIAGTGMINVGSRTSDLSREEASEFIEFVLAFGAQHGVVFTEPSTEGRGAAEEAAPASADA